MYKRHQVGRYGEELACEYLILNKYIILERNFYCNQGEIDIIVWDIIKKEVVFVEVKTRTNFMYGRASESINIVKQNHLKKCIKYYIYKNKLEKYYIRFDVIEVYGMKTGIRINHIKQIF